jgi:hypothetical protein
MNASLFLNQRIPKDRLGNQSQRDRAAKDTIAFSLLPQLPGESINETYLPPASGQAFARQAVFDLTGSNAV